MLNSLLLYWRYLAISIRGQLQYRAAFGIAMLGEFLINAVEILGIWALFDRFGTIGGWTLPQVALFYGVTHVAFALADALSTGFDKFGNMVKNGDFDRILLRPRGTVLQLAGQELAIRRLGRLSQGSLVLIWAIYMLEIQWTPALAGLLAFTIIGGICLFFGLMVLQATLCFWTTETLEIVNITTYGGVETAQYPLSIYHPAFRRFFTFVIPLACVSYFPLIAIMGIDDPLGSPAWFQWIAPVAGIIFLLLSLQAWRFGVRYYTSTGS